MKVETGSCPLLLKIGEALEAGAKYVTVDLNRLEDAITDYVANALSRNVGASAEDLSNALEVDPLKELRAFAEKRLFRIVAVSTVGRTATVSKGNHNSKPLNHEETTEAV